MQITNTNNHYNLHTYKTFVVYPLRSYLELWNLNVTCNWPLTFASSVTISPIFFKLSSPYTLQSFWLSDRSLCLSFFKDVWFLPSKSTSTLILVIQYSFSFFLPCCLVDMINENLAIFKIKSLIWVYKFILNINNLVYIVSPVNG